MRTTLVSTVLVCGAFVSAAACAGCTASTEKPAIGAMMVAPDTRAATFEATARVLDDHPDFVDEFYAVAQKHPKLMERFLQDASAQMEDPAFSKQVAEKLMDHPKAVEEVLKATVDEAKSRPKDRVALARAVAERSVTLSDILTDSPHAVKVMAEAQADAMMKKEGAKRGLLAAMQSRAAEFAAILVYDPETMHVLLDAMVKKATSDKLALKDLFKSVLPESLDKAAAGAAAPSAANPAK